MALKRIGLILALTACSVSAPNISASAQPPDARQTATEYPLAPAAPSGIVAAADASLGYAYAGATDRGAVRPKNEDSFWVDGAHGVFIVADGMGGHEAGEVASSIAAKTARDWSSLPWIVAASRVLPASRTVWTVAAYHAANAEIYAKSRQNPDKRGMGTTAVAAIVYGRSADILNVGDSRGYLFRDGTLTQISKDQSLLQAYIDKGMLKTPEEIRDFPYKNIITQAMGTQAQIVPDVFSVGVRGGDAILLCSDGVTNELTDSELAQIIAQSGGNAPKAAQDMIAAAKARGARDNVTAVVVLFAP